LGGVISAFLIVLCCIPLLIPGMHSGMQSNTGIRVFTVLSSGLIATLICYSVINGISAASINIFGDPNLGMEFYTAGMTPEGVVNEIWWRLMIPSRPCYASQQEICDIADQRIKNAGNSSITNSLSLLGLSILLTLPSSIVLLFLSRPKKPDGKHDRMC
jgi:hypothetical protein